LAVLDLIGGNRQLHLRCHGDVVSKQEVLQQASQETLQETWQETLQETWQETLGFPSFTRIKKTAGLEVGLCSCADERGMRIAEL
jgi:hypothetical protein